MQELNHCRIILIETLHAGNLGSAARSMKTMGFSNLILVSPQASIDGNARALSAGALDILQQAKIVATLEEALVGVELCFATSARERALPWQMVTPEKAASLAYKQWQNKGSNIAIIFGPEDKGLNNEQLQCSHYHIMIPAYPGYPVLNLSHAIQLVCYEFFKRALEPAGQKIAPLAPMEATDELFNEFKLLAERIGYATQERPGLLLARLKRFFLRAQIEKKELKWWHGIIKFINRSLDANQLNR